MRHFVDHSLHANQKTSQENTFIKIIVLRLNNTDCLDRWIANFKMKGTEEDTASFVDSEEN